MKFRSSQLRRDPMYPLLCPSSNSSSSHDINNGQPSAAGLHPPYDYACQ